MKRVFYATGKFLIAIVAGVFISSALADWSPPAANPPAGGLPSPLTRGAPVQTKSGGLTVNFMKENPKGLIVFGKAGIGTALPQTDLHVVGRAGADKYCARDGAWCFPSSAVAGAMSGSQIPVGMILAFDDPALASCPTGTKQVLKGLFPQGVAPGGPLGTTGGASMHSHGIRDSGTERERGGDNPLKTIANSASDKGHIPPYRNALMCEKL